MTKTILVVDDDESLRMFLSNILSREGYSVVVAKDRIEGLQLAIAYKPDLILSDIEMPRFSGYQLLEELKQEFDLAMIPVILISGLSTTDARNYALRLGAADYLSKLALPDIILESVTNCLRRNDGLETQQFRS